MLKSKLAIAVRRKRLDHEMSFRDVAKASDVGYSTVWRAENSGRLDLESFEKLCRWLEHDPNKYLETPHRIA